MMTTNAAIWMVLAFLSGALPFSVWVGRLALRADIRRYGDHNPGATNVLRAGGKAWAGLALFLDMMKGALPVGLAWYFGGLTGWPLVLVSLAPLLGHAYSPFLGFKGGKALAVTAGVWGGLTFGLAAVVMSLLLVLWYVLVRPEGWAVLLTAVTFLICLLLAGSSATLLAIWLGTALLIGWKHRHDLRQRPSLRPWLGQRLSH